MQDTSSIKIRQPWSALKTQMLSMQVGETKTYNATTQDWNSLRATASRYSKLFNMQISVRKENNKLIITKFK